MEAWLATARRGFHDACLAGPITETKGVPSIADVASGASRDIARALVAKIGASRSETVKPGGQSAGAMFESVCQGFLSDCFARMSHLRPGKFMVEKGQAISLYDQFALLDELRLLAEASRELKTLRGTDYLIKPDIVVVRDPETDDVINSCGMLVDDTVARNSALRAANGALPVLHASVSCKLTCSIPDDHIDPRRSALFMARSILREVREGVGTC